MQPNIWNMLYWSLQILVLDQEMEHAAMHNSQSEVSLFKCGVHPGRMNAREGHDVKSLH